MPTNVLDVSQLLMRLSGIISVLFLCFFQLVAFSLVLKIYLKCVKNIKVRSWHSKAKILSTIEHKISKNIKQNERTNKNAIAFVENTLSNARSSMRRRPELYQEKE